MQQHIYMLALGLALGSTIEIAQAAQDRSPQSRTRSPNQSRPGMGASRPSGTPAVFPFEFRKIDGFGNNLQHPEWGQADHPFVRRVEPDYADGLNLPSGADRPNPRTISNGVSAQAGSLPNTQQASDFLWVWGQFLDHDLTETPVADPREEFNVPIPLGDPYFDPTGSGTETMALDRSSYDHVGGRREQVNEITAYIDGSQIYGSDSERSDALRTLDGTGRLRTSAGDFLPFNTAGLPNAPDNSAAYYLAGDIRANEQVLLTVMHTVFVREHNFWADTLQASQNLDGESTYQAARAIVIGELQAITYREFLPTLLGSQGLAPYRGYRENRDASIQNLFAASAFRLGHSMLPTELLRLDASGQVIAEGNLALAQAFFRPDRVPTDGLEVYLRGAAHQEAQDVDPYVVDGVRNFLFGAPGSGGLDLVSLNLQRGRDHGLPSMAAVRRAYGLPPVRNFSQWTGPGTLPAQLQSLFGDMRRMDTWVGFLSERKAPGSMVGPTLARVLRGQFEALRDGDRFYYEVYLPDRYRRFVETQTLAVILRRNTALGAELQADVFHAQ